MSMCIWAASNFPNLEVAYLIHYCTIILLLLNFIISQGGTQNFYLALGPTNYKVIPVSGRKIFHYGILCRFQKNKTKDTRIGPQKDACTGVGEVRKGNIVTLVEGICPSGGEYDAERR